MYGTPRDEAIEALLERWDAEETPFDRDWTKSQIEISWATYLTRQKAVFSDNRQIVAFLDRLIIDARIRARHAMTPEELEAEQQARKTCRKLRQPSNK